MSFTECLNQLGSRGASVPHAVFKVIFWMGQMDMLNLLSLDNFFDDAYFQI